MEKNSHPSIYPPLKLLLAAKLLTFLKTDHCSLTFSRKNHYLTMTTPTALTFRKKGKKVPLSPTLEGEEIFN
jgi:hypothetical protein